MMDICILTTGGTIDKDYPRSTGGYAFEINEPAVGRILESYQSHYKQNEKSIIPYEVISVCKKDSTEITDDDRQTLCDIIAKSEKQRFLITHGTDTIIHTARYIQNNGCCTLKNKRKMVVCTGAMKPERFKDSDADFNIGGSIVALRMLPPSITTETSSVFICMGGNLIDCVKCYRDQQTGEFLDSSMLPQCIE